MTLILNFGFLVKSFSVKKVKVNINNICTNIQQTCYQLQMQNHYNVIKTHETFLYNIGS